MGRFNPDFELLVYNYTQFDLTYLTFAYMSNLINYPETIYMLSDAMPFRKMNFPSIHIKTEMHNDYYRMSDIADKISNDGQCLIFD